MSITILSFKTLSSSFQRAPSAGYTYTPYQPKVLPSPLQMQPATQYPVHPDVRLKKLPFFDLLGELLKPSSLMPQGTPRLQENTFMFHLTPQQATDIASSRDCRAGSKMDYIVQVCRGLVLFSPFSENKVKTKAQTRERSNNFVSENVTCRLFPLGTNAILFARNIVWARGLFSSKYYSKG